MSQQLRNHERQLCWVDSGKQIGHSEVVVVDGEEHFASVGIQRIGQRYAAHAQFLAMSDMPADWYGGSRTEFFDTVDAARHSLWLVR